MLSRTPRSVLSDSQMLSSQPARAERCLKIESADWSVQVQHLTGETFAPDLRPRDQRIVESTNLILDALL